ncbi:MAG: electron transport complex subunit RsxC [Gammaproteobacteria bacterium]|nr:electron transport complex subunit RsxC [Gammaproteobacteria bacterium]
MDKSQVESETIAQDQFEDELTPTKKPSGFYGGLRLPTDKHELAGQPLRTVPVGEEIVLPLKQHAGLPAIACVEAGQKVLRGQRIAQPDGFISAAVHASTSGIVTAIEDRVVPHPSGLRAPCIIIKPDGEDQWCELDPIVGDYHTEDPVKVRQRVRDAGIAGLGGAVFPTSTKLTARADIHLHTLILNGAECDPEISCDETLMHWRADDIIAGARIILHVLQVNRCVIGIEEDKPQCEEALRKVVQDFDDDRFEVVRVPAIYPEGSERQLIQALSGEEVPSNGLPLDIGYVCVNVGTAAAVRDAVIDGKPLTERTVTVTGKGIREPANVVARLGPPVSTLVDFCGGYTEDAERLVIGGAMMGFAVGDDAIPVVKACNSILAMTAVEARSASEIRPCIRCGECARVCPSKLLPQQLYWHAGSHNHEQLERFNLFDCIECGCCDYVCPSNIRLAQHFRFAKAEIAVRSADEKRAQLAKSRYEDREARLSRKSADRAARLNEKKRQAAAVADTKKRRRVIEDVMERVREKERLKKGDSGQQ